MRVKIASRKSDLARLQALTVARELKKKNRNLEVEHEFTASLGDKNLDVPLWTMGSKGVFTEDFHKDLLSGRIDMVVHSWKDLPTEMPKGTKIVATLPREDIRDVLLVNRSAWKKAIKKAKLLVLTSSPRRLYNLKEELKFLLPGGIEDVEFRDVRGNIPTRIDKLLLGDGDALVMAKAAIDRLLSADFKEFDGVKSDLAKKLKRCLWMVLPLSINPAAAAQGALAIEIAEGREDLENLIRPIQCQKTFDAVRWERDVLSSYGGGCHQKIGVSRESKEFGDLTFLKGVTDEGEVLNQMNLLSNDKVEKKLPQIDREQAWSAQLDPGKSWFTRQSLEISDESLKPYDAIYVGRSSALIEGVSFSQNQVIWVSGVLSWKALAKKGFWINGCSDGLGEHEAPKISHLTAKKDLLWCKLSHTDGVAKEGEKFLATYRLCPSKKSPDLSGKRHFFWKSGSSFERALSLFPEIEKGTHYCGPGHTAECIESRLGPGRKPVIFLNEDDWLNKLNFS